MPKKTPKLVESEKPVRLLSRVEVTDLIGISYVCLWQWIKAGRFPAGRSLGDGPRGSVRWDGDEVYAWIKSRARRMPKGSKRGAAA